MIEFTRSIHYYETDKMGITHHANYIHLMEEARAYYLEQIGWSYPRMESLGLASPVTKLSCRYLASTTFADPVHVALHIKSFNGVTLTMAYTMRNQEGKTVFTAESEHCFLNAEGRLILLRKVQPELERCLMSLVEEAE